MPPAPRDRAALAAFLDADPPLAALREEARSRLSRDPGHDLHHALRVALSTLRILEEEAPGEVPPRLAAAAALLHDVVNVPKDSPDRGRASELSAGVARDLLLARGFPPAEADLAAEAIRDHSFSRGAVPASALGRALQDADRLDALGALGVMRTVSTGVLLGADYFDPEDPWARARPLDDRGHSVDHFFTKLLRLPSTMRTEAGRREARPRAAFMEEFLRRLGEEIGEAPPGI